MLRRSQFVFIIDLYRIFIFFFFSFLFDNKLLLFTYLIYYIYILIFKISMYLCFKTRVCDFFFFFWVTTRLYLLIDKGMNKHVGTTLFKSQCLRSRIYRVYLRSRHWCLVIVWWRIHFLYICSYHLYRKFFHKRRECILLHQWIY